MKRLPSLLPVTWRQHYEALRQHILAQPPLLSAEPLGLVVLVAQGLAGWMHRWRETPAEPLTSSVSPILPRCPIASPGQQQLTRLLAQMTTPHL
jgi:hypothetical protein